MSLASESRSETQKEANRIDDYQKSHRDILHAPETVKVVTQLLEGVRWNDSCREEALIFHDVGWSGEALQYTF